MGNFSVYLTQEESDKVIQVAQQCNVKKTQVLRIMLKAMPVQYLAELIDSYKD